MAQTPGIVAARQQPTVEERRALIERVAASEQFSRSARLRDFLLYVGRQSLKEGCPEIHEQEIGIRVFGRSASYDRSQDNIVRVNATELRKRVDAYFAGAGAQEELIFEIPRGAYKPLFRWRQSTVEPASALLPDAPPAPAVSSEPASPLKARRLLLPERLGWALLSIALFIACAILWQQNRDLKAAVQPAINQPTVSLFWTGFLDPHRETDLVLPDDSASIIEDITQGPIQLGDYLSSGFMRRIQSSTTLSADRKADLNQIFMHNLVTFGAVRAAQAVIGQIPPKYPRYLTLARNFTADQLTRNNAILLGGSKSVPWGHLFDEALNFDTDYDYVHGVQFVRNRAPKPGEQLRYAVSGTPDSLTGYAVIAYLPNPSHTGHALLVAGTDSDATGAAASFLTSEDSMSKLRTALHVDRFPYFEVLLKISRVSGTFFGAEPIAYRTYPTTH